MCKAQARQAGLLQESRISVNGTQELQLVYPLVLFCLNFSACLFMSLFVS